MTERGPEYSVREALETTHNMAEGAGAAALAALARALYRLAVLSGPFIPGKATDNTFVPRLWATRRVGFLLASLHEAGLAALTRTPVYTALGERRQQAPDAEMAAFRRRPPWAEPSRPRIDPS